MEQQSSMITEQDGAECDFSFSENHTFNNPGEILLTSTAAISQNSGNEIRSCFECLSDSKVTVLQATDLKHLESSLEYNTTVPINDLLPDQLNSKSAGCSVEVQQTDENSVLVQSVSQAFEQFNGHNESVLTIIVPSAGAKDPFLIEGSFITVEQELDDTEAEKPVCITTYGGTEVTQTEHSYCRQDTDKEQLWQKITKLNAKIALLEVQERKTLSRLKSLEVLITKLKQENLLSEEKLKIVENCFTTFEVTMIQ